MNNIENLIIKRNRTKNKKVINEINDAIAFEQRDINHTYTTQEPLYKMAELLSQETSEINSNDRLTFFQSNIYKSMIDKDNLWISAKTSFGKTWLAYSSFLERVKTIEEAEIKPFTYIHIVPSEIIEAQVRHKIKKHIEKWNTKEKINVEKEPQKDKFNYIVGTPEKIYPLHNKIKNFPIEIVIVDEAHELFYANNERSKFFKFCVERLSKDLEDARFWFIGAFLKEEKIKELKLNDAHEKLKPFSPVGFQSRYVINYEENSYLKNQKLNKKIHSNNKGIILNYHSSLETCREEFQKNIRKNLANSDFFVELINRNTEEQKKRNELCDELDKNFLLKNNFENDHKRYDVLDGLRVGIALYHAKIPLSLKERIFAFAEQGLLNKIYSTSAIISGLDINIETININKAYIGKQPMRVEDFFNLAGRSGRYKFKQPQDIGVVNIKQTAENNNWFHKNKPSILSRPTNKNEPTLEEWTQDYNITETLKELSKENIHPIFKENLLIDPRIHPKITEKLTLEPSTTKEIFESLKKMFNIIDKTPQGIKYDDSGIWVHKEDAKELFLPLLELYTSEKYKFKSRQMLYKMRDSDIKIIRNFLKYIKIKDENKMFLFHAFWSFDSKNPKSYSEDMTKFAGIFYNEIKYALFSYVSHFLEICKRQGITEKNLEDIMSKEGDLKL